MVERGNACKVTLGYNIRRSKFIYIVLFGRQTSPSAVRQNLPHGGRRPTGDEKQRADYRHRATFSVPARLFGAADQPVVQVVDPAAARAREAVGNGEAAFVRGVFPGADKPETQRRRALRRQHFYQGLYALRKRSVVRPLRFSRSLGFRLSLVEEWLARGRSRLCAVEPVAVSRDQRRPVLAPAGFECVTAASSWPL
jgi:hypothetical protein